MLIFSFPSQKFLITSLEISLGSFLIPCSSSSSVLYWEDIVNGVQSFTFCFDQEEYLNNLLLKRKEVTDKHAPLRSLSRKETKIC